MTTPTPARELPPHAPVRPCRFCRHEGARLVAGSDPPEWECACPPRGIPQCHAPKMGANLTLNYLPFRFKDGPQTATPIELDWDSLGLEKPNGL